MAVYANDWIGINVNLYGIYEGGDLSVFFEFLSPLHAEFGAGLAIDVGANVGNHSIFFDKYFGKTIAFEPSPSTYDILKFNSKYTKSVNAINCGLGDVAGEFELFEDLENFGRSVIKDVGQMAGDDSRTIKVKVRCLDDFGLDLSGLGLIKIDVEGFEASVVRGAKNAITRYEPVILFEQNQSAFNSCEPETVRLLREMGYSFCWIRRNKVARTWLGRRITDCINLIKGGRVQETIVTASSIPAASYSMVMAVPSRHKKTLGL